MAVTDIAEDDLDEMMREEAEDVFYEDGRIAKGQMWTVWKRAWVYRWAAGPRQLAQLCGAVRPVGGYNVVTIRVKERVKTIVEGRLRGLSPVV